MTHALGAFEEGKIDQFLEDAARIQSSLSCLSEIPLQTNISEIHRFQAFHAYAIGDADRVEGALSGWLHHDSLDVIMGEIGSTALSESLIRAHEHGPVIRIPFLLNDTMNVYLDGGRANERGLQRGTLVQFEGEDGRVVSTQYVHAGERLPSPLVEPGVDAVAFGTIDIPGGKPHRVEETDCTQVDLALTQNIDAAVSAFAQMDRDGFSTAVERAEEAIPCSPLPMSASTAAAFFRVRGLRAFMDGRHGAALRNFQSAYRLQPGYQLPSGIATPGSEIHTLYQLAQNRPTPTELPFQAPRNHRVIVNGQLTDKYAPYAPNIFQLLDKKGAMVMTLLLEPGERLPAPFPSNWDVGEVKPDKPQQERRSEGILFALRGGASGGMIHRYYREGLITEPNAWVGYGTGFRSDGALTPTFGLSAGVTGPKKDLGLSIDVLPSLRTSGEARIFSRNSDDVWYDEKADPEDFIHPIHSGFAVVFNTYGRYRFKISPIFDLGVYGQLGLSIFGPFEYHGDTISSCAGNPERCPLGDGGAMALQIGAGPTASAHITKGFRVTIDVPFTAYIQTVNGSLGGDKVAYDHAWANRLSSEEKICVTVLTLCGPDESLANASGDWSNNAYDAEELGSGFSQFGWTATLRVSVQFVFPQKD